MEHLLSGESLQALRRFASSSVLLAFDFDGTLAPIRADPERARMRQATRALLGRIAALFPCIVISGRSRADLAGRLEGIGLAQLIGNHGSEPGGGGAALVRQTRGWRAILKARLGGLPGVVIEDKKYSLAVHYRRSRQKPKAYQVISSVASKLRGARIVGGKQVLNLLVRQAPHKGDALGRERTRLRCERALYVGDDETDEDVFRLGQPERLLTVRVGTSRSSAARYFLRNQLEVDRLLRALIGVRQRAPGKARWP